DGGWDAPVGWGAAWAYTAWLAGRHRAQRRALGATLLVATAVWWGGGWVVARLNDQGPQWPAVTLATLQGGEQSLADFAGRPVVLNLWATWCPPCQREMPALQRAQQQYPGVHFVFANQGESREQVQRFVALKGLVLQHMLLDEQGVLARHFQERALPTTFFFDASGALVDTRTGELSDASIAQRLARWPQAAQAVRP
ncbi:MAG: TlpA disulfide reductase family protein, partial [Simplicispira sp.]|nr:TlpA disulfide reductase family protein [Simplicispira sp.]